MIRAVLDTNVLVSALITAKGAPAVLLRRWLEGAFELVVSPRLLTELSEVLDRRKFHGYADRTEVRAYVEMLRARAVQVEDASEGAGVSPDPDDDLVIALAAVAASVLVTGDDQMRGFRAPNLPILSPRAFLEAIEG